MGRTLQRSRPNPPRARENQAFGQQKPDQPESPAPIAQSFLLFLCFVSGVLQKMFLIFFSFFLFFVCFFVFCFFGVVFSCLVCYCLCGQGPPKKYRTLVQATNSTASAKDRQRPLRIPVYQCSPLSCIRMRVYRRAAAGD